MPIPIDNLVRSRRKTIALVVQQDGTLTVRAPLRMTDDRIREFVEKNAGWIAKTQVRVQAATPPPRKRYIDGENFLYLGKTYPLALVPSQRPALKFNGSSFSLSKSAAAKGAQAFVRWYKGQAKEILTERVSVLAKKYGFTYQKIRISSARTRWGSCSSTGTLSFTYRLIMTPLETVDYVIVHELVHTKVKNHSKSFWRQVQEIMPEYKTRRAWLKKNGQSLM